MLTTSLCGPFWINCIMLQGSPMIKQRCTKRSISCNLLFLGVVMCMCACQLRISGNVYVKVLGPDGSESCLVFRFVSLGPVHFSDPAFTWTCSLYSITEKIQLVGKLSFLRYCDILQGPLLFSLRSFNNIQAICSLTTAFYTLGSIL